MTTTTPTLPRQTCRGHLERGESYTVGTMPNGELRPYSTEVLADGRRFHYCATCSLEPVFAARIQRNPDDDLLVDAHVCPYCMKPVEAHYEPEAGLEAFYSVHFACLAPEPTGRFLVLGTSRSHVNPFSMVGARFAGARSAIRKAVELERSNTPFNGTRFGVVDLETNEVLYASERAELEVELEQARRTVERLERSIADRMVTR